MSNEGHRIDPENWDAFRDELYKVVDACVSRLENARALPWKPKPSDMDVGLDEIKAPQNAGDVFHKISQEIMPFATGNTHPQFFGWVHGTGVPAAIGAEIFTATMNSNCGGRDHGAMEVERAVIDFCTGLAGMPDTASGILTSGTSQATILAFSCARRKLFGPDVLTKGIKDLPDVRVYMADGAHSCILKALEVLGHGARSLRKIERDENGRMRVDKLAEAVEEDRANGIQPLAVVGTAGSVNLGYFDPIDKIADYCEAEDIWLHCDAAFGFWTLLADAPWNGLAKGIGRANSIATDFHKWLSVPYDCGACLVSDRDIHRSTFTTRPAYLAQQDEGLAGGDLWFCDYGVELSRGFKALKVWSVLQTCGTDALGAYISDNCRQARLMGELVQASDVLELARPVVSNLCCFWPSKGDPNAIAAKMQLAGEGVLSTTIIDEKPCLRAAIVNHRTTSLDIRDLIANVEKTIREI